MRVSPWMLLLNCHSKYTNIIEGLPSNSIGHCSSPLMLRLGAAIRDLGNFLQKQSGWDLGIMAQIYRLVLDGHKGAYIFTSKIKAAG